MTLPVRYASLTRQYSEYVQLSRVQLSRVVSGDTRAEASRVLTHAIRVLYGRNSDLKMKMHVNLRSMYGTVAELNDVGN